MTSRLPLTKNRKNQFLYFILFLCSCCLIIAAVYPLTLSNSLTIPTTIFTKTNTPNIESKFDSTTISERLQKKRIVAQPKPENIPAITDKNPAGGLEHRYSLIGIAKSNIRPSVLLQNKANNTFTTLAEKSKLEQCMLTRINAKSASFSCGEDTIEQLTLIESK